MSYLKALGIFRLVSEQADRRATSFWKNDHLLLRSKLGGEELLDFFLNAYEPSPIVGPWAGGSGFFDGDNQKAVERISSSTLPRGNQYREVIKQAQAILRECGIVSKPSDNVKELLLRRYRSEMPDGFVQWMDAAMVIQANGQKFAPVLGTGGNDGRLDFPKNFMQRLVDLGLFDSEPASHSAQLLENSLFGKPIPGLQGGSVGQFAPGRSGGPNATQGMEGKPTDNPWDYVLMLEGSLMLAGSLVRRLGLHSTDKAAFPFTVRPRAVGTGSLSEDEMTESRGELWLPIWDRRACLPELQALFAEGRAELNGQPAQDAVDFARAVAELGVARGIRSFSRYVFLQRSGKAYLATASIRFDVPNQPRQANELLQSLDRWLERFRRACSTKDAPLRLRSALHKIDSSIFDYCRYGRRQEIQRLLIELGQAERALALTAGKRGGKEICPPLGGLPTNWLKETYDRSAEYNIALSLASLYDREKNIGPFRVNLEAVTLGNNRWSWSQPGPPVVWNSTNLVTNMASVLRRRMMDASREGSKELPLHATFALSTDAIAAFLVGSVDDSHIERLVWGLTAIDHRQQYPSSLLHPMVNRAVLPLPREYALLKLLFLPGPIVRESRGAEHKPRWRFVRHNETGITIRSEPRVLPLLRANRVDDACQVSYQRLIASGLTPLPGPKASGVWRKFDWGRTRSLFLNATRLAGALLLPINDGALNRIISLVTRQEEQFEPEST